MYKKLGCRNLWNEINNVFINIEAKICFRRKLVQGLGLGSVRRIWCFEPHLFHILPPPPQLSDRFQRISWKQMHQFQVLFI